MRISSTPLPVTSLPLLGGDMPLWSTSENAKPNVLFGPGGGVQFSQRLDLKRWQAPAKNAQSPNLLGLLIRRLLDVDERTTPLRPLTDTTPATRTATAMGTTDATVSASNPAATSPEAQLLHGSK